jgi:hypothetical protein
VTAIVPAAIVPAAIVPAATAPAVVAAVQAAERQTDPRVPLLTVSREIAERTRVPAGVVAAILLRPEPAGGAR